MNGVKEERVWNDPPGTDPNTAINAVNIQWKLSFVGGLYLLTGAILYVVINYADLPAELIPSVFFIVGGGFLMLKGILYFKERRKK